MSRRVAVVVVHGVADQERCSSARAAADLLRHASLDWADFMEDEIRVKVEAVKLPDQTAPLVRAVDAQSTAIGAGLQAGTAAAIAALRARENPVEQSQKAYLDEYRREVDRQAVLEATRKAEALKVKEAARDWWRQTPSLREGDADPGDAYMTAQLSKWVPKGDESSYRAARLRSTNQAAGVEPSVFEMHWADLSRLDSAIWRPFVEAFQLIFYLATLGRWTVEQEQAPKSKAGTWMPFVLTQVFAEFLLVRLVPLLNLLEFVALLPLVAVCRVPEAAMRPGLAVMAAVIPILLLIAGRRQFGAVSWPWLSGLAVVAGMAGWHYSAGQDIPLLFSLGTLLAGVTGASWIASNYDRRFEGALFVFWGIVIGTGVSIWFWPFAPAATTTDSSILLFATSTTSVIWQLVQRLQTGLFWTWKGVFTATILTFFFGGIAILRDWGRARATATGWATLLLSITLVFCLNIGAWQFAQSAVIAVAPEFRAPEPGKTFQTLSLPQNGEWVPVGKVWDELMGQAAVGPLIVSFFFLVALGFLGWSLLPAVMAEWGRRGREKTEASRWLGQSLSTAFQALWFPTLLLLAGIVAVAVEESVWPVAWLKAHALHGTAVFGVVTAGLLLGKGPFEAAGLVFRQVLDVVLDVLNWLRLDPLEENVRARVCGRYVSLLRHIVNDGSYDAIVILAHSQGTVITADLLRYLQTDPQRASDNQLDPLRDISLTIFSMGCPLRQLYSERFPTQYGWARGDSDWTKSLLGVDRWINAYTSGDYVGRNLWPGTPEELWTPVADAVLDVRGGARKFCIGEGAHLGYWSPDQVAIREVLDSLVRGTAQAKAAAQTP